MGKIVLLSAPTNLGLRPPEVSSVPGCSKAPEALREAGLYRFFIEMGGIDGGATIPDQFMESELAKNIIQGLEPNQITLK